MDYLNSKEIAKLWLISERSVRNYCSNGRVEGAFLEGGTWMIPENAQKPARQQRHSYKKHSLLEQLLIEKESKLKGGIYHKLQIELCYNSNHIEGSKLTHDQTRLIFETRTIGKSKNINVDDIIESSNHFRCFDFLIDNAKRQLSESMIKQFHAILKTGTHDSMQPWFKVGDYKIIPNEVGGEETANPKEVKEKMKNLLKQYNSKKEHSFEEIVEFHVNFERIHPFQDGNGRVGRLIAFKECLKNNIVPFIILDIKKDFYYRGLKKWSEEKGYLLDTCLDGQDTLKRYLDYFDIKYQY